VVYLIVQILWFLLAAAAIGFAVGWLCRSAAIRLRRETVAMQARATQGELEGQRGQLEARLAEAASAREALQEEVAQLRQAAEADAKARRKLEGEHASMLIRLEAREREVARLGGELAAGRGDPATPPVMESPAVPPAGAERAPGTQGSAPVSGSFVRQK
jgi:uncharacterized membrane-anchored protein YhcB (DUF1043 family)